MRRREAHTALVALGSQLLAGLVSSQALAETKASASVAQLSIPPETGKIAGSARADEPSDEPPPGAWATTDASLSVHPRAAFVVSIEPQAPASAGNSETTSAYVDGITTPPPALSFADASAPVARVPAPTFHRAPADATNPQISQRRILGYIAGSLGLAGIGLGATTSVIALTRKDPLDRQCADPIRICSPDGKAGGGGHSLGGVSVAGWALGVLGITTGAALILTSNPKTGRETALGTDFYRGGAGLKVSRTW